MKSPTCRSVPAILLFFFFLSMAATTNADTWYVDSLSACSGSCGHSWQDPFGEIQDAIDAATAGDEIWVKGGTYLLTLTIDVNKSVDLYGGFAGTESSRGQRDWETNITTIDGFDSIRCVLVTEDSIIDGFHITNGYTEYIEEEGLEDYASDYQEGYGGGLYNDEADLTIRNCTFSDNYASQDGGAVNNHSSSLSIADSVFTENQSDGSGAALRLWHPVYGGYPTLERCTFSSNTTLNGTGGAIDAAYTSPIITHCIFEGNQAYTGAAIYDHEATDEVGAQPARITNCLFIDNIADHWGGAITTYHRFYPPYPVITNCTFSGNEAGSSGGAVLASYCSPIIMNSILWINTPDEIYEVQAESDADVSYSDVKASLGFTEPGTGNINEDPLYVTGPGGDYDLSQIASGQGSNSPCLDAGDPASDPWGWNVRTTRTDERPDLNPVDMGYHYERSAQASSGACLPAVYLLLLIGE